MIPYHVDEELTQRIRAGLPTNESDTTMQTTKLQFLTLTAPHDHAGPIYVAPQHITAMHTDGVKGTTLYMAGGKHITVRELPIDIGRMLSKHGL